MASSMSIDDKEGKVLRRSKRLPLIATGLREGWDLGFHSQLGYFQGNCLHPYTLSKGYTKARKKRRRCVFCGKVLTAGIRAKPIEKAKTIFRLYTQGVSVRNAAKETAMSTKTVVKIFGQLKRLGFDQLPCPCGQAAGHRGWCAHRVSKSPRRQDFLKTAWGRVCVEL